MTFQVTKAFPPDEEHPIAEIVHRLSEKAVELPAIVRVADDTLRLVIYDREGRIVWDYPLDDLCEALDRARSTLRG